MASASVKFATKVPPDRYPAIRSALRAWWAEDGRRFPWREAVDPFAIFLAEQILQKTQVAKVEKVYAELIKAYPDPAALANAPHTHLERVFGWLGLVKRARYVREAARAIVERHGGVVPRTADELKALPGVGEYSANAVLCFAHSEAVPIVDSAIARLLKRLLGFASEKPAWKDPVAWAVASSFLDTEHPAQHNYALLDLAALVCVPQAPRCSTCPVSAWCASAPDSEDEAGPAQSALRGALDEHPAAPRGVDGQERRFRNGSESRGLDRHVQRAPRWGRRLPDQR